MRSFFFVLLFCLLFSAGCRTGGGDAWHFSEEDSGLSLDVRVGDEIFITLQEEDSEEDSSSYFWKQAQPVNPKVLLTGGIKRGMAKRNGTGPDLRVVQYRFLVIGEGYSGVSLEYRASDAPDVSDVQKRFDLLVKSKGKPLELKDIFEDGPPPDTMTDSKGNVVPKPAELPGSPNSRK